MVKRLLGALRTGPPLQGEKIRTSQQESQTLYYIKMDNQKRLKRDKELSQLKGKSAQEKSKMTHSMINQSSGSQRDESMHETAVRHIMVPFH